MIQLILEVLLTTLIYLGYALLEFWTLLPGSIVLERQNRNLHHVWHLVRAQTVLKVLSAAFAKAIKVFHLHQY